jgi:L-fucose mutarotase/ribose pyranase (RbsD/FucU family)
MKKYIIIVMAFILFSLTAQATPMLKGLSAEEFAARQTDMLKDKINLAPELVTTIGAINLDYANQIYTLCDADKTYPEIKKAFYDLIDKKKSEISKLLPPANKDFYTSFEDKYKQVTWNEIKKYIRQRGVK